MRVAGVSLSRLLGEYERQCEVSEEIIATHALEDIGKHPRYRADQTSLRWIPLHMIEETARHADILRELLDGGKGYF